MNFFYWFDGLFEKILCLRVLKLVLNKGNDWLLINNII